MRIFQVFLSVLFRLHFGKCILSTILEMYSFHLHQTVSHFSYVKVYRAHVCNPFRLDVVHIRPSVLLDTRLKFSKRQTIGRAPGEPSQLLFISVYRHAHTFQIHKYLLSATIEIRNVILVHLYRHCSGFILHDYLLVDIARFIVSCDVCFQYPIIGDYYRRFLRSILTVFFQIRNRYIRTGSFIYRFIQRRSIIITFTAGQHSGSQH